MSNAPASILDRLRARAAPTPTIASTEPVMVQTAFGYVPVEPGNEAAPGQIVVQPGQINPPEFQKAPTAEELKAKADESKPETPAAKRTRRTKAEMEAARAAEAAALVAGLSAETTADGPADGVPVSDVKVTVAGVECSAPASSEDVSVPHPDKPSKPIPVLFINCFPIAGTYVLASALASQANAKICADQSIYDYRAMQYGAGPGALRHAVMEQIDGSGNCPPIMVDTGTPEGSCLVSDLESRAVQTIRGLR